MKISYKMASCVGMGIVSFLLLPTYVQGQLNNKPFSFNTPSGMPGMSIGGMEAVLNDKILGMRPENMVRGTDGRLLTLMEGPGNSAIVSYPGGSFIPGYKGSGYAEGNSLMSAGAFNPYFVTREETQGGFYAMMVTSGDTINTWTGRIVSGSPVSYAPYNSVDSWTGMVQINNGSE